MRQLVTMFAAVLLLATAPLHAQHLGSRLQWQPEIADLDSRLQQKVEIEILGRAAVPALELLSEATGVSLSVAPEDLTTVGERKLTIISKGLTLKAIMVQLPNALQECHWDIDATGDEPIYLLHRNGSADRLMASLAQADSEPDRQARLRRIAEARAALNMSPAELDELEQTDLYLARTMKEPTARACVEAFFDLPPAQMDQLTKKGGISLKCQDLPPSMQQETHSLVQEYLSDLQSQGDITQTLSDWRENLPKTTISLYADGSHGVWMSFYPEVLTDPPVLHHIRADLIPPGRAPRPDLDVSAHLSRLQARTSGRGRPGMRGGDRWNAKGPRNRLLTKTGTPSEREAERIIIQTELGHTQARERSEDERRAREWTGRNDPDLQYMIDLDDTHDQFLEFVDLQMKVAAETDFSIVSDFFSQIAGHTPSNVQSAPLWELLYRAAERSRYQWHKVDNCLVFHHREWYERVPSEVPESLLFPLVRKCCAGELTLDDVCALVKALPRRDGAAVPPKLPRQLLLYLRLSPWRIWAIDAYTALDSEQRAALRRPEGVKVADLPPAARDIVVSRVTDPDVLTSQSREDFEQAVFHLEDAEKSSDGGTIVTSLLYLEFPDGARHTARFWFPRFPSDITYTPLLHADPQPPS
ncbi:MAG: hypothetical protein MUQ65_00010 [Armatimonadetes bacterium]|nr:hypothetical protein [Armatimonadota bacterium]